MTQSLKHYCSYIQNSGKEWLPTSYFDEDWEPVGPRLRIDLIKEGLIFQSGTTICLTQKGRELIAS